MKLKKVLLGSVLTCSALPLAACSSGNSNSSSSSSNKNTVNFMENAELPTMDTSTATDTISFDMLSNSNEGLYRLGKDSAVEPGLATKTTVSKDGKIYTFDLRKAKWSNGDQVTAGKANPSTLGIKAEGDYKLVVTLERPIKYFKLLMGFASFFPQNQKVVEKYGSKYGTISKAMVYNGPYKLEGWTGTNNSWKLVKNNSYWDKKSVKMSTINFQVVKDTNTGLNLYTSNKLDETILSGTQVKNYKNNKAYVARKNSRTFYLELNQKDSNATLAKAFKNENIRKALSLAINRNQFVNDVLADGSTAAKGYVSTGLAKNPKTGEDFAQEALVNNSVTYNAKLAKEYWAKGLKEIGEKSLTFSLLADDTDNGKKTTEYLQGQWTKTLPNLKVNVKNVPFKIRLSQSEKGQFDVVVSGWGADMVAAEKILMQNQGVIAIYQPTTPLLLRNNIKGIIYNSAGVSYNFKEMYVK